MEFDFHMIKKKSQSSNRSGYRFIGLFIEVGGHQNRCSCISNACMVYHIYSFNNKLTLVCPFNNMCIYSICNPKIRHGFPQHCAKSKRANEYIFKQVQGGGDSISYILIHLVCLWQWLRTDSGHGQLFEKKSFF